MRVPIVSVCVWGGGGGGSSSSAGPALTMFELKIYTSIVQDLPPPSDSRPSLMTRLLVMSKVSSTKIFSRTQERLVSSLFQCRTFA
jgi:hypothetical protein